MGLQVDILNRQHIRIALLNLSGCRSFDDIIASNGVLQWSERVGLSVRRGHSLSRKKDPFHTRSRVETSNLQFSGVDTLSSKAHTIESFINPKAHKSLSKCKVDMLKVRYEGENGINDKSRDASSPLPWAHKTRVPTLNIPSDLHEVA